MEDRAAAAAAARRAEVAAQVAAAAAAIPPLSHKAATRARRMLHSSFWLRNPRAVIHIQSVYRGKKCGV